MHRLSILLLVIAATAQADLPPAPTFIGDVKRDEHGTLIVVPGNSAIPPDQSPQSQPATPPVAAKRAHAPKTGTQSQASSRQNVIDNAPPQCAQGAVTCIEVVSTSDKMQSSVPLTFGQPFKAGHIPKGQRIVAQDVLGRIPLQMDEESTHYDGSIRFAVLSTQISNLKPDERRVINLYSAPLPSQPATIPSPPNPSNLDIKLAATIFSPQITKITFGNRNGNISGIPYEAGEQITMQLGDAADDRFTLTISNEEAGGHFPTLTKIANAFVQLINTHSRTFRAYKLGEGMGYENLWITRRATDGPSFTVKIIYAGKAKLSISNQQEYQPPHRLEADARPALERMLNEGPPPRLNGPVAREYSIVLPLIDPTTRQKHPQLTARLHTRWVENGQRLRTDLVMENNWIFDPQPGNITYDLTVRHGKQILLRQEAFTHYHHARWHKVLWSRNNIPQFRLRHNMPYFLESRATWNYDLSLAIPESVLAEEADRLSKADIGPMGAAFITPYFPTTGGRHEIGPLPRWTALFLVTQDTRALASMLTNADAAGGIPIHYRDSATDLPVSLERHPTLALLSGKPSARDNIPPMKNSTTPWTPDIAHQASFSYIPYLITGDLYYLEETLFWTTWNLASINPSYRETSKGLLHSEQIRGQAWALRSLGESAYILPDKHPMKNYFMKCLSENLNWYLKYYTRNNNQNEVSPLGFVQQDDMLGFSKTAPWQNDFMSLVIGLLTEFGNPLAEEYFHWLSKFTVGRFINEANGFCRFRAPSYWIKIRDNDKIVTSWDQLYRLNWPYDGNCKPGLDPDGYPDSPAGYIAYARAMLAESSTLGIANAQHEFEWISNTATSAVRNMSKDPTWAIVPRTERRAK